jgi:hypothetical protein
MRIESKTTTSSTDQQLGPLAPLVRAAEPLDELTAQERLRIKHRLRTTLLPSRRSAPGFRWSTALAALGLLLAGGVVFAAAGRFGLIPWPRTAEPQVSSEQAAGQVRRRPVRGARPRSTTVSTPAGTVDQAGAPAHEEIPAVVPPAPPPAAGPVLSPPSSGPAAAQLAGPRLAKLEPATTSPRLARLSHVTPGRAVPSPTGGARNEQAMLALPGPHSEMSAVAPSVIAPPPVADPVLPSSTEPAVARGAMREPPTASPRSSRATHVTPATSAPPAIVPTNGQAMLGKAMRSLRNDRDPAAALDILARHAALFPQSPLASERSVLEVEALLALGRDDQALLGLDRMSLDNTPRSAERYVVRGELRARAKRWQEAGADFDRALAHGRGTSPWQERALWGRAVTRTQAGDHAGARADLQLYLQIYPTGRFASEVARLLAAAR